MLHARIRRKSKKVEFLQTPEPLKVSGLTAACEKVASYVRVVGYNKDFGFGFYCTRLERQAQRWAISKRNPHIVCTYEYTSDDSLIVKCFENMTDEWLDFVASCRHGDSHNYDIVEGPMADDEVWDYVEDFLAGRISREAFWALAKFKHPTHQIFFSTDRALHTLKFISSYQL